MSVCAIRGKYWCNNTFDCKICVQGTSDDVAATFGLKELMNHAVKFH